MGVGVGHEHQGARAATRRRCGDLGLCGGGVEGGGLAISSAIRRWLGRVTQISMGGGTSSKAIRVVTRKENRRATSRSQRIATADACGERR